MEKRLFTIEANELIADGTMKLTLAADDNSFVADGEFVDVSIPGYYLRRPLSFCDTWPGHIVLIYKMVGEGTKKLSRMEPGLELDLLTGLGNGFDASACKSKALIVCGGIGASPTFSLAKELLHRGKKVNVILGFNRADEIILADEYRRIGAETVITTVDGSEGVKGFVTDAFDAMAPGCDYFYTCGPKVMMKAVCGKLDIPGEVSLEERMGCGCGICFGCTCHTTKGPRRVCAEGPVFKKEEVIW